VTAKAHKSLLRAVPLLPAEPAEVGEARYGAVGWPAWGRVAAKARTA
jgi:hypothetical protein